MFLNIVAAKKYMKFGRVGSLDGINTLLISDDLKKWNKITDGFLKFGFRYLRLLLDLTSVMCHCL